MRDNKKYKYQNDFSTKHPNSSLHEIGVRRQKAMKTISVLEDYLTDLGSLSALDIGCSKGLMTSIYADSFEKVTAIDIDKPALAFAIQNNSHTNLAYYHRDAMDTRFEDESFDVIICTHVYEHVPDSRKLMAEIHRLLKVGGVCYFAAGNRLVFLEGHYKLPLLSVVPKYVAHLYLRLFKKGTFYYEKHLTVWSLKKLVSEFKVIDYTQKILMDPQKFHATEMLKPGSLRQKLGLWLLRMAYWLSPSYVWLLQKDK